MSAVSTSTVSTTSTAHITPIAVLRDVQQAEIIGEQPDRELRGTKRWIVFKHPTFDKIICGTFTLTNDDPFTVAFCIKCRDRSMFSISEPYGILHPNESVQMKLYLRKADRWSRPILHYADVRHQLCIENLRVPDEITPNTPKDGRQIARDIYKRTYQRNPMQRLYWKLHVVIVQTKKDGDILSSGSRESLPLTNISA